MEKQEVLDRIHAIKNIIQAATNGERIKLAVKRDMDKGGMSFPEPPKPIYIERENGVDVLRNRKI